MFKKLDFRLTWLKLPTVRTRLTPKCNKKSEAAAGFISEKLSWVIAVSVREKDASIRLSSFQARNIKPLSSFSLSRKEKYTWLEHKHKCVEMDFTRRVVKHTESRPSLRSALKKTTWKMTRERLSLISSSCVSAACSACQSSSPSVHNSSSSPSSASSSSFL